MNNTLYENRFLLALVGSILLHTFLLLSWEQNLPFDFGGQQLNQQRIEIALAPPAPEQPHIPPPQKVAPRPIPPPAPPEPKMEKEVVELVEHVTMPEPQQSVEAPAAEPPKPARIEPTPQPKPKRIEPQKQPVPFQQQKITQQAIKKRATPQPVEKTKVVSPPPQPVEKSEKRPDSTPSPKAAADAEQIRESEAIQHSQATIRRLIQAELVRHFHYPRIARRKGWQGRVQLAFTVLPNGILRDIVITEGSRHGILNRSAINTMKQIDQLHQLDKGMLPGPVQMEIPIIYQLQ